MPHLYLEQWNWGKEPSSGYWQAPYADKCIGVLDLRSIPQMSKAGGTPEGYGLFAYNEPVDLSISIRDLVDSLTLTQRQALKQRLGNPDSIPDVPIGRIVAWLLTQQADILGWERWNTLIPGMDGKLKLYFANRLVWEAGFNQTDYPQVVRRVQENYRTLRARCLESDSSIYKKYLSVLERKYRLPYQTFIPSDLPDEGKLPAQTTITESFTGDGDALGYDLTWVEYAGDLDRVSGQAKSMTTSWNRAYANTPLSSDDHYAQATGEGLSGEYGRVGTIIRKDANSTATFYSAYMYNAFQDVFYTIKRIDNAATVLNNTDKNFVVSALIKVQADGSTITSWYNGTQIWQGTDTSIDSKLYTGLETFQANNIADNFEAGDLGGVAYEKSLSDAFAIADSISKAFGGFKVDSIALADSTGKAPGLAKADDVTLSDVLSKATAMMKAETVAIVDSAVKAVGKFKIDTVAVADSFARVVSYIRNVSDSLSISDSLRKAVSTVKADTMAITESLVATLGGVAYLLSLFDTVIITDALSAVHCTWTNLRLKVSRMAITRLRASRTPLARFICRRFFA